MQVSDYEVMAPEFATVMRGYDRLQVDAYLEQLRQWIAEAEGRAMDAEAAARASMREVENLQRRLASFDDTAASPTPTSIRALGDRVSHILEVSQRSGEEIRRRAEESTRAVMADAEERAGLLISEAADRAQELAQAAEELYSQAGVTLRRAEEESSRRVEGASQEAAAQREAVLELARRESERILGGAKEDEKTLREQISALHQQRDAVINELGLLHERLGSIGKELTAGSRDGKHAPAPTALPASASAASAGELE